MAPTGFTARLMTFSVAMSLPCVHESPPLVLKYAPPSLMRMARPRVSGLPDAIFGMKIRCQHERVRVDVTVAILEPMPVTGAERKVMRDVNGAPVGDDQKKLLVGRDVRRR